MVIKCRTLTLKIQLVLFCVSVADILLDWMSFWPTPPELQIPYPPLQYMRQFQNYLYVGGQLGKSCSLPTMTMTKASYNSLCMSDVWSPTYKCMIVPPPRSISFFTIALQIPALVLLGLHTYRSQGTHYLPYVK